MKPGRKREGEDLARRHVFHVVFGDEPEPRRALQENRGVHSAPVVLDLDDDVVPFLEGVERDRADGGLAHRETLVTHLDRVIDRVPDHVHHRVGELFDDELVDLRLRPGHDEVHLLVVLARNLTDDPRQLVEDLPERDHPHLEDAVLHLGEVAVERAVKAVELDPELPQLRATADALAHPKETAPQDRKLADDRHERVELADVDPHRLAHRAERELAPSTAAVVPATGRRSGGGAAGRRRLNQDVVLVVVVREGRDAAADSFHDRQRVRLVDDLRRRIGVRGGRERGVLRIRVALLAISSTLVFGPLIAVRRVARLARLAIRISSSIVSMSPAPPVGR